MKVNSPSPLFAALERIRTSESSGEAPKRERDRSQGDPSKDSNGETPEESASSAQFQAELQTAVGEFAQDGAITSNGLQAEVAGQGPGLRVTLKDGRGAVVRQFTGEEFLRLREAASAGRGRLLDKKL
jgi:hypothetical protein